LKARALQLRAPNRAAPWRKGAEMRLISHAASAIDRLAGWCWHWRLQKPASPQQEVADKRSGAVRERIIRSPRLSEAFQAT
jgi:hypothetical protein